VAEVEELEVPGSKTLAEDERRDIDALEEVVVGDHVKQEILVQAGDSEAIARRLGQRTQASLTYPAEEEDAKNIAEADVFEIEDELVEQREAEAKARAKEIEAEGEASAKANAEGKSALQQTMDAHKDAVEDDDDSLPRSHAELDEIAAEEGVDLAEATSVADKQEAIRKARG